MHQHCSIVPLLQQQAGILRPLSLLTGDNLWQDPRWMSTTPLAFAAADQRTSISRNMELPLLAMVDSSRVVVIYVLCTCAFPKRATRPTVRVLLILARAYLHDQHRLIGCCTELPREKQR